MVQGGGGAAAAKPKRGADGLAAPEGTRVLEGRLLHKRRHMRSISARVIVVRIACGLRRLA